MKNTNPAPELLGSHRYAFDDGGHPVAVEDFSYEEIDRRAAAHRSGKAQIEGTEDDDHSQAGDADRLAALFEWLLAPSAGCSIPLHLQPLARLLVLIHSTRPDLLGNPTLTELAENQGWPKQKLSMLNADLRKRFGFQSRSMKSVSAVAAYRERFERLRDEEAHRARMAEKQFDLFSPPPGRN